MIILTVYRKEFDSLGLLTQEGSCKIMLSNIEQVHPIFFCMYLWFNEKEVGVLFQDTAGLGNHHSCSLPCHLRIKEFEFSLIWETVSTWSMKGLAFSKSLWPSTPQQLIWWQDCQWVCWRMRKFELSSGWKQESDIIGWQRHGNFSKGGGGHEWLEH